MIGAMVILLIVMLVVLAIIVSCERHWADAFIVAEVVSATTMITYFVCFVLHVTGYVHSDAPTALVGFFMYATLTGVLWRTNEAIDEQVDILLAPTE